MIASIIYLLAITIAEIVTVGIQPIWGIACHISIFVAVLVHSAVLDKHFPGRLILALALVPLIRIISLSLPLANIPQIWWYLIIYVPLLVAAIVVAQILGYKREDRNRVGPGSRWRQRESGIPVLAEVALSWGCLARFFAERRPQHLPLVKEQEKKSRLNTE